MKKEEYVDRFKKIYSNVGAKNQEKAEELIDKLADVLIMMEECKEHIDAEGCVSEMCQGNYSISRENPWSKVYDSKSKTMLSILDRLDKMMPDGKSDSVAKAGENLAKFVALGKPVELR